MDYGSWLSMMPLIWSCVVRFPQFFEKQLLGFDSHTPYCARNSRFAPLQAACATFLGGRSSPNAAAKTIDHLSWNVVGDSPMLTKQGKHSRSLQQAAQWVLAWKRGEGMGCKTLSYLFAYHHCLDVATTLPGFFWIIAELTLSLQMSCSILQMTVRVESVFSAQHKIVITRQRNIM